MRDAIRTGDEIVVADDLDLVAHSARERDETALRRLPPAGLRSRRSGTCSIQRSSRSHSASESSPAAPARGDTALAAELAKRRCPARSRHRRPARASPLDCLLPAHPARPRCARSSATSRLRRRRPSAARVWPSARRRSDRPRRSFPTPARTTSRRVAITMKSCTSTRRPACAPPPKIWICGKRQTHGCVPPRRIATAASPLGGRGSMQHGQRRRDQRVAAKA